MTSTKRGRGRPPDLWKRRQKELLLALTVLDLPPAASAAEFEAALEARVKEAGKWKSKDAAIRAVAEQLGLSKEAIDRFVYPRRKKKAPG